MFLCLKNGKICSLTAMTNNYMRCPLYMMSRLLANQSTSQQIMWFLNVAGSWHYILCLIENKIQDTRLYFFSTYHEKKKKGGIWGHSWIWFTYTTIPKRFQNVHLNRYCNPSCLQILHAPCLQKQNKTNEKWNHMKHHILTYWLVAHHGIKQLDLILNIPFNISHFSVQHHKGLNASQCP